MRIPALLLTLILPPAALADEGMWPYNRLPLAELNDQHRFRPEEDFLRKLQQASVRLNNGGSGSFVSPQGLVMTNHHVASDCIRKLSSEDKDYIADGFYAGSQGQELACPDLELNVLLSIEEVTDRMNAEIKPETTDAERLELQKAAQARIESECQDATGLRCDVVNLYQGGVFDLYRYKRYTDVRLVFAPEFTTAYFGGDPDNFTYPRYCLDVAFLRVYEADRPAMSPAWMAIDPEGSKEGDLTLVSGHPGSTKRLLTSDQLAFERDRRVPFMLAWLKGLADAINAYGRAGGDAERTARDEVFRLNNSIKAYTGQLQGLRDRDLFAAKVAIENELKEAVQAKEELREQYGDAWEEIAQAQVVKQEIYEEYRLLEGMGLWTRYFTYALTLHRLSEELPKPNEERLPEYTDAGLDSLYQQLYSTAPIYPALEKVKLIQSLSFMRDRLGVNHPVVKDILGDSTPQAVADRVIEGTKLGDPEFRKELGADQAAKVPESDDPMLELVRKVDDAARKLRKRYEDEVDAVEQKNGTRIARSRFDVAGDSVYPDATFTLRLAFGRPLAYLEDGERVDAYTRIEGLFERHEKNGGEDPYVLPRKVLRAKGRLDMDTPYNLVSTNDITGGNSGSPLISAEGKVVGLIFDGNIQSLSNDFLYSEKQARAVSVDVRGILEMLQKVYRARRLVEELTKSE